MARGDADFRIPLPVETFEAIREMQKTRGLHGEIAIEYGGKTIIVHCEFAEDAIEIKLRFA
jgi:hypothetical protein